MHHTQNVKRTWEQPYFTSRILTLPPILRRRFNLSDTFALTEGDFVILRGVIATIDSESKLQEIRKYMTTYSYCAIAVIPSS